MDVLGSTVHLCSADEAVSQLEEWITKPAPFCRQVVVSGFHAIWEAHRNEQVRSAVRSADLWLPDGIAPVWAARLQGIKAIERATGADLMRAFLTRADQRGLRTFFYGDTDETLMRLTTRLRAEYPGHQIAGTFSPPFRPLTPVEDEAIIEMINNARPDVLWVGLGTPKQDCWIAARRERLRAPVAAGVGAAFRFLAGSVSRCPAWIGNAGFEWAYRLIQEPKKLWKRDIVEGPRFLLAVCAELAERKFGKGSYPRIGPAI